MYVGRPLYCLLLSILSFFFDTQTLISQMAEQTPLEGMTLGRTRKMDADIAPTGAVLNRIFMFVVSSPSIYGRC